MIVARTASLCFRRHFRSLSPPLLVAHLHQLNFPGFQSPGILAPGSCPMRTWGDFCLSCCVLIHYTSSVADHNAAGPGWPPLLVVGLDCQRERDARYLWSFGLICGVCSFPRPSLILRLLHTTQNFLANIHPLALPFSSCPPKFPKHTREGSREG